jgi:hypothetical protein
MPLVLKSEYAKHRGVNNGLVSRWTKAGRIAIVDGLVDVEASDAMLAASLDPTRGGRGGRPSARTQVPTTTPAPGSNGGPPAAAPEPSGYALVRTQREGFAAKTAEVEYRKMIGELVEREPYNRALAQNLASALQRLDSISSRLGARLAAEADVRKCQDMIDDEVQSIRQEVADTARQMIEAHGKATQ